MDGKIRDVLHKAAGAFGLLDTARRKAWRELTGEPFDVSNLGFGAAAKD